MDDTVRKTSSLFNSVFVELEKEDEKSKPLNFIPIKMYLVIRKPNHSFFYLSDSIACNLLAQDFRSRSSANDLRAVAKTSSALRCKTPNFAEMTHKKNFEKFYHFYCCSGPKFELEKAKLTVDDFLLTESNLHFSSHFIDPHQFIRSGRNW